MPLDSSGVGKVFEINGDYISIEEAGRRRKMSTVDDAVKDAKDKEVLDHLKSIANEEFGGPYLNVDIPKFIKAIAIRNGLSDVWFVIVEDYSIRVFDWLKKVESELFKDGDIRIRAYQGEGVESVLSPEFIVVYRYAQPKRGEK